MAKTIKEIADELGVDKQTVYRYIKKNHINEVHHEALQKSGVKRYDEAAESLIKQGLSEKSTSSEALHEALQNRINDAVPEALIDMLRKELEIKNEQIRELNERLAESNAALVAAQQTAQAAQALHAGTMQQHLNAAAPASAAVPGEPDMVAVPEEAAQPTQQQKKKWWQRWM